jgi:signal transduction histidine kinase
MTRPFKKLTRSIQDVQEGYQSHFEPVETFTETTQLSEACSDMLGRLKRLDDSREEFVSNVSHELKTPLTSMKVLADSLVGQENVPNEIYRDFMKDIAGEIDRENSIINDLLSLVSLNQGSEALNIKEASINDMLDLLMKRLRPIAEQQQVELLLESFRPVTAEVDEGKLTLAFSNLIENAIKYNRPEGYVHVTLNADHENFFLNVIDNGIGIPQESQEHIFDRFYRTDASRNSVQGGSGIGLSIVKKIIEDHSGKIWATSQVGRGTTMHFVIRKYQEAKQYEQNPDHRR